jgi:hypothetical protein
MHSLDGKILGSCFIQHNFYLSNEITLIAVSDSSVLVGMGTVLPDNCARDALFTYSLTTLHVDQGQGVKVKTNSRGCLSYERVVFSLVI